MPGRMESVENLSRQQYRVRGAVDGFPPFPPPLGNRYAIPTVPQPRRRRYLSYEQETQGDTSIELPRGTFLLGVDMRQKPPCERGASRLCYTGRDGKMEASDKVAAMRILLAGIVFELAVLAADETDLRSKREPGRR